MSMLLCDFHIHTTWSDGSVALPEVVDIYGQAGFDVISITDHVYNSDSTIGSWADRLNKTIAEENFPTYMEALEREAERARTRYGMLLIPGVSILKPLKGVDDRLLDNLESFCRLDYPRYEIVFCVQGASDPALRVARRVKETHPGREIVVVVGDCQEGLNPKVNNMMPGYAAARYPFVLIRDSNVAPAPGYLREAMAHFQDPSVGLVSHLVRGIGAKTLGDRSSAGWVLLGPIRDVLAAGLWFSAFFSRNVEWRGRTLRITRGSRLVPVGEAPAMEPATEAAR
jgi:cellulose synthase/poly-beta-1,6-N-acetylglucosamine synthase-like glycosyltransferase